MCLCLGFSLWKVLKFVVGVVLVLESCVTLCGPVDCSPPGSSVQGISQARILEWVAISFSRGSSWPGDRIHVSCMAGEFFTIWATLPLPTLKCPKSRTLTTSNAQENVEQHKSSFIPGGMQNGTVTLEDRLHFLTKCSILFSYNPEIGSLIFT